MTALRLFKYVPPERIDILELERISFSPPERFNDVFDTKPLVVPIKSKTYVKARISPYRKEALDELPPEFKKLPRKERRHIARELHKFFIGHTMQHATEFAGQLQRDIPAEMNKTFGLLCLSAEPNHALMWAHYARGHEGFIIEFNANHPGFQQLGQPHEVIYSEFPPVYDPVIGSEGWWKIKRMDWRYEREYRIVTMLKDCHQEVRSGVKLYFRGVPRVSIKSIFIGLKAKGELRVKLREICQQTGIELFEANYSPDGMAITFKKS